MTQREVPWPNGVLSEYATAKVVGAILSEGFLVLDE